MTTDQKPLMTTDKGPPIQKVARPPVNTPDGCHRNSLENSNICVFRNIQTLTRVFLPETDMRLSQRNLGAPPVARGSQSRSFWWRYCSCRRTERQRWLRSEPTQASLERNQT